MAKTTTVLGMSVFMIFTMTLLTHPDPTSSWHCASGPCNSGQYQNSGAGTCLPCPDNTFMAQNNHSCTDCHHCTVAPPNSHTVLVKNCSPKEDAVFKCESGYYESEESRHSHVGPICEKCGDDTEEKCSADRDHGGDNSSVPTSDVTPLVADDNRTHKNKSIDDGDGATDDVSQKWIIALAVLGGSGIIIIVVLGVCKRQWLGTKLKQAFCFKYKKDELLLKGKTKDNNAPNQENKITQDVTSV